MNCSNASIRSEDKEEKAVKSFLAYYYHRMESDPFYMREVVAELFVEWRTFPDITDALQQRFQECLLLLHSSIRISMQSKPEQAHLVIDYCLVGLQHTGSVQETKEWNQRASPCI